MYKDTITLFNHYQSSTADIWCPTILKGVDLNADRAVIAEKFGVDSKENAMLHIRLTVSKGKKTIGGKPYLLPKEWENLPNDEMPETVTVAGGNNFSFFVKGEWGDGITPVADEDYPNGFYEYMNQRYDEVYAVSSVAEYSVIPHLEIAAR